LHQRPDTGITPRALFVRVQGMTRLQIGALRQVKERLGCRHGANLAPIESNVNFLLRKINLTFVFLLGTVFR
jgi:hypothetical protein